MVSRARVRGRGGTGSRKQPARPIVMQRGMQVRAQPQVDGLAERPASVATHLLGPADLQQLQRTVGNRAVQRLLLNRTASGASVGPLAPYAHFAQQILGLAGPLAVKVLFAAGIHDPNQLTNLLFWARHPEMMGQKIRPGQKDLARDWRWIRNHIVEPALETKKQGGVAPGAAPAAESAPSPAAPHSATPAPAAEKPSTPAPAAANSPPASAPPAPSSPGATSLQDQELATYVAALNNPAATAAAHDLAALEQKYRTVERKNTEEKGSGRDTLVADIAALRKKITELDNTGLDPTTLAELKARLYRGINAVAPFYSQSRNIDLLEGKEQAKELGTSTSVKTRTCNITSLSMALESLGKSAADYDGSKRGEVAAAARVFSAEVRSAELTVAGKDDDWSKMAGLRLSDFMELAAIAEVLKSSKADDATVTEAAVEAWDKILNIGFLKQLAERFGASGIIHEFTLDPEKSKKERKKDLSALSSWGGKHRTPVEQMVDARNKMEAASGKEREKYRKIYEKALEKLQNATAKSSIEESLPLEAYRDAIIAQVGSELDGGAAVVVNITGHYVRLQSIHDDHVVVDDPAQQARANRKVTWEEARAMGYFKRRLVIS